VPLACRLACLLAAVPSGSYLLYVSAAGLTDALLSRICRLTQLLLLLLRLLVRL
jgi:hypothetical protein